MFCVLQAALDLRTSEPRRTKVTLEPERQVNTCVRDCTTDNGSGDVMKDLRSAVSLNYQKFINKKQAERSKGLQAWLGNETGVSASWNLERTHNSPTRGAKCTSSLPNG